MDSVGVVESGVTWRSVVRCGQNDVFSVKVEGKQKATVDCVVYKSHPHLTYTRTTHPHTHTCTHTHTHTHIHTYTHTHIYTHHKLTNIRTYTLYFLGPYLVVIQL